MKHLVAGSCVAVLSTLGACVLDEEEQAETSVSTSELTNSPATAGEPATVLLRLPSGHACTGSMLTRHWILTAAHCAEGQTQGGTLRIVRGITFESPEVYSGAAYFIPHPDYGGTGDWDDDVGLIRLTGSGIATPTVQMGIFNGNIASGDQIHVVGYGVGSDVGGSQWCGDGAWGTKREQTFTLEHVTGEMMRFPWGSSRACSGDSGAPYMWPHDVHVVAAGVHSGSRDGWWNDNNGSRTSAKRAWIEQQLATSSTPAKCAFFAQTDETSMNFYGCYESAQEVRPNQLSAGRTHACAVLYDGRARCWGDNTSGQLGDGTTTDRTMPVSALWAAGGTSLVRISAGWNHTCAGTNTNEVTCWGSNASGQLGNPTLSTGIYTEGQPVQLADGTRLADVRRIASGGMHTCALTGGGRVYCWGANSRGQLGNDTTTSSMQPTLVGHYRELENDPGLRAGIEWPRPFVPLENVVEIDAGYRHTCASKSDGTAYCWGDNTWGQLGNATTTNSPKPVKVASLTNVFRISAGYGHSCATYGSAGDQAACWGYNVFGQLANGTTTNASTPRAVSTGLGTSLEVSAGYLQTCFTGSSRYQKCAGYNASGELGNNSTASSSTLVSTMIGGNARAPAAGNEFTCTFTYDGHVMCTGLSSQGQLGGNNLRDARWPHGVLHLHHLPGAP